MPLPDRHSRPAMLLHHVGAVAVVVTAVIGFVMVDLAPATTLRLGLSGLHIVGGLVVLAVTVRRLVGGFVQPAPLALSPPARRVVDAVHGAMFVVLCAAGATGAMTAVGGLWLDAARGLPRTPTVVDVIVRGLHEAIAPLLLGLAGVHVAGVLLQEWRRGGVLRRMWPGG